MYDWHHNITVRPVYGHVPTAKDGERTLLGVTAAEQKGCNTNHSNCTKDVVFVANIDPAKLASGSYSASIMYTATARPKPAFTDWDQRTAKVSPSEVCRSGDNNSSCLVDLDKNMIPVKYTGTTTNAQWTSISNPEDEDAKGNWYDYGKKQWANAVTVKKEALAKYQGQDKVVDQADILGFWVYIPRYTYEVMRRDGTDKPVKEQNFDIKFENTKTPKKRPQACKTGNGKDYRTECNVSRELPLMGGEVSTWSTHPVFSFGKKELNGVWFGKFDVTGDAIQPTVLPNESYMSGNIGGIEDRMSSFYALAKTLGANDPGNVGGDNISTAQNNHHLTKFSSHMVNNNDWGAVVYLSASKYGVGYNGVQKNAQISFVDSWGTTGCGPSADGSTDSYRDVGTFGAQSACSTENLQRAYNGSIGQLASTTSNVTGIYDMSGNGKYVAASYINNHKKDDSGNKDENERFISAVHLPYANTYNIENLNDCTFDTCGGQALYETNNGKGSGNGKYQWKNSYLNMNFWGYNAWLIRDEFYSVYHGGGQFYISLNTGPYTRVTYYAFRVALAPTAQN